MLRWFGAACVFLGCVLLAFDGRWTRQLATLPGPGSHGVHASEALGFAVATIGVAAFWVASGRPR